MPTTRQKTSATRRPDAHDAADVALPLIADALYRAACEACRQQARYARLVERDAPAVEQDVACELVGCCDKALDGMRQEYERRVSAGGAHRDEDWWHVANRLLQATREYLRHERSCTHLTSRLSHHTPERLTDLTIEYELAASALLALRQAVDDYRRARPEAELTAARS